MAEAFLRRRRSRTKLARYRQKSGELASLGVVYEIDVTRGVLHSVPVIKRVHPAGPAHNAGLMQVLTCVTGTKVPAYWYKSTHTYT